MLAATKKTLITALAAAAGLAAIAVTPAAALGDVPSPQAAQAADARAAAAALITGPKDSSRPARVDVDPANGNTAGGSTPEGNTTEGNAMESHPFNVSGEDEMPQPGAATAGTDTPRRLPRRRVRRRR